MLKTPFEVTGFEPISLKLSNECTSIFRLEMLQSYDVSCEDTAYQKYQNNESPVLLPEMEDWCNVVVNAKKRGSSFNRVRIIKEPISDYLKFESLWGYQFSFKAGEMISVLNENKIDYSQFKVPALCDFWLFGDTECYIMLYDCCGRFMGVSQVNEYISEYSLLRDKLLNESISFSKSSINFL